MRSCNCRANLSVIPGSFYSISAQLRDFRTPKYMRVREVGRPDFSFESDNQGEVAIRNCVIGRVLYVMFTNSTAGGCSSRTLDTIESHSSETPFNQTPEREQGAAHTITSLAGAMCALITVRTSNNKIIGACVKNDFRVVPPEFDVRSISNLQHPLLPRSAGTSIDKTLSRPFKESIFCL
jgi:hypothetical protein